MKKLFLAALLAALMPSMAHAVAAPTGLTASAVSANTSVLMWTEDATVNQWYIYIGGALRYQPNRNETGLSGAVRSYLLQNLPNQPLIVVSMKALSAGSPLSAMSAAITITSSTVPVQYFMNPPGVPILVSGTVGGGGGGGGDATAANQVIGNASLSSIDGKLTTTNSSLSSILGAFSGVTVNPHAVTQGGPWTVSGSVTTIPSGAAQAVSVLTSVLPTNAATSALQTSGNSTLSSILTGLSGLTISGGTVNIGNLGSVTITGTVSGNQTQVNGVAIATGNGVAGTGVQRMTIASDNSPIPVSNTASTPLFVSGTVSVNVQNQTLSYGQGVVDATTQRMVMASNSAYLGATITSVTATNISTNMAQFGGTNVVNGGVAGVLGVGGNVSSTVTDTGNPIKIGAIVNTTLPTFTVGARANAQADVNGRLYIAPVTLTTGTSGSPLFVSATGAGLYVVGNGDGTSDNDTIETNLVAAETYGMVYNPATATWDRMRGNLTGGVFIQGPVSSTVTVAGNPLLDGNRAATTLPTAVADGSAVFSMADKAGRTVMVANGPRERKSMNNITLSTTGETTLLAAGGAGVFRDLETLVASNGSTQTVRVDFRDATAGTVRFSAYLAPGGGGAVIPAGTIIPQTTAANNWTAQLSTGITTNDIRLFCVGNEAN